MRHFFLFEQYIIKKNGTWCLVNNYRLTEYDKRKQLADMKRKGYHYDRGEKAYMKSPDPVESVYRYAVTVTRYTV